MKILHVLAFSVLFLSAQHNACAQFFAGPVDQDYCLTAGSVVNFAANYIVSGPTPTSFTFSSTDITINLAAPMPGVTNTLPGNVGMSGASYTLSITNSTTFYLVNLSIDSGITLGLNGMTYTCTAADGIPTVSSPAELIVASPITVSIDDPASLSVTACEGADITIDASTSAIPDSYAWKKVGGGTVGTVQDLTLSTIAISDAGTYELTISDAGCPDITSSSVAVMVDPNVTIADTDMTAKELNPGDTKTYTATASNIDVTSTFTWVIDGHSFTGAMLPSTIMVGTNSIQVNSISNVPVDATTKASTLSLSNITALPSSTNYTAAVQMTAANNSTCAATTASVMSGATTVFPVEWAYFTANVVESHSVELKWATASENNNDKFIIERSTDGKTFDVLDEVLGSGTTQQQVNYAFIDNRLPLSVIAFYRLKQIDFDGTERYSDVRSVRLKKLDKPSLGVVYMNGQQLFIPVYTPVNGESEVRIFDSKGMLILKDNVVMTKGQQLAKINIPTNIRGVYFLQLLFNDTQMSTSFIR